MLFGQFVANVLKLHQDNIKELTLHGLDRHDDSYFTTWIDTPIARGVERLDVASDFHFKFPLSVFSCKTIIDLKLSSKILWDITRNIPSTPIFPCLKKLDVTLYSWNLVSFKHMVSLCSSLEHLIVDSKETHVHIVSSSLKWLQLERHSKQKILVGVPVIQYPLLLRVPTLEYLQIDSILPLEFIVTKKLSSLLEARICFHDTPNSDLTDVKQLRDSFVRLIQPLSNVKVLRLECRFRKYFNSVGQGLFLNLTNLEIVSNFFEWRLLVSFMESSINLQAITVKRISTLGMHKLVWKEPKKVPICLSSSLKKISIDGYECSEDELKMVKYVLRNAQILKLMDIYCANDMIQKIQKLPRACERCEVSLLKKL